MSSNEKFTDAKSAGRKLPGARLWVLTLIFGVAMGIAGFAVGRATMPPANADLASLPAQSTAPSPAFVESTPQSESQENPAPSTATSTVQSILQSSSPTPAPSVTPLPTDQPAPAATAAQEEVAPTAGSTEVLTGSPLDTANLSTLYEVWKLIAEQYDGSMPPAQDIVESMIAGSLETLDDNYTRYVSPEVAKMMRQDMEGSVEGIGAIVRENEDGLFEIVRPLDGQPADLAGLMPGDILIEVDGQSVIDVDFNEVILMVRGPEGTSVTLKFLRENEPEPLTFTIVRTRFEVPVVEFEILPPEQTGGVKIGYIRLTEFNRNAEEKLREALDQILSQEPSGLIFDLRDNPGGFLDQSVAVADAFLPEGIVLFERNIRGLDDTFGSDDGDSAESIPLVVLVNSASASASEIVAGAIQDRGRAVLVGETTFGKGSVQQIYPLSDGSELRVTIARWYTPNNNTIDSVGITPDIEIATPDDLGGPDDTQLQRAIEYLLTGQ